MASKYYSRDTISEQASEIGSLETIGLPWKTADEYIDKIRAVTAEQVLAVARKYLIDDT